VPFKILSGLSQNDISYDSNHVAIAMGGPGSEGIVRALIKQNQKILPVCSPIVKDPARHPVLIIPQAIDSGIFNNCIDRLREYVAKGGAVMLVHDTLGYRGFKPAFPEIGQGVETVKTNTATIAMNHVISMGMNIGDSFRHAYCDHVILKKGQDGAVICADQQGRPVLIAGGFGKGRVILNGMATGYSSRDGSYNGEEKEPEGAELQLLINSLKWLEKDGSSCK